MPITIVLADDHAVVREGLRALLETRPDLSVVGDAANGLDAIEAAQRLQPSVVIMDISMPEMNGIDAAAEIRRTCPAVQVVILSVHATSEHVFRAMRGGAMGYVLKESAGQEVVDAVRAVNAGRRYLSPRIADVMVPDVSETNRDLPERSPLERLSQREREVLQRVVEGWSSSEIATRLDLSPKTVETYRSRLMTKLGVRDVPGLVRFAIKHGLTHE
jgi:DNA-binding NarL/FixJ family response regulator